MPSHKSNDYKLRSLMRWANQYKNEGNYKYKDCYLNSI